MQFTPFKIAISDAQIDDLKARLEGTRWPAPTTTDWSHGQPVPFIRELAEQWRTSYDWRQYETRLNAYPQFLTEIDGQTIHFLHVKSTEPGAFPLILTHGWPSTIYEFIDVIGPLTDPRAHGLDPKLSFDLVIPSIPGYGFSSPLAAPGWDSARIAKAWDALMKGLGYKVYGAQGGDAGALITRELGILQPEGLAGVHLQQIFAFPTGAPGEMDKLTPFEREGFANLDNFLKYNGYQVIQQKRPGTLAYGLVDSPVGQLAWNTELFFGFDGMGTRFVDRERFLTHASIYWFTGTGASAAQFPYEAAHAQPNWGGAPTTPVGMAVFGADPLARRLLDPEHKIAHWSEFERGGHFPAMEVPDQLVADLRAFFRHHRAPAGA